MDNALAKVLASGAAGQPMWNNNAGGRMAPDDRPIPGPQQAPLPGGEGAQNLELLAAMLGIDPNDPRITQLLRNVSEFGAGPNRGVDFNMQNTAAPEYP